MKSSRQMRLLCRFRADCRAFVTPLIGVAFGVLVLSAGAAVDYTRAWNFRADLQSATDRGLMAALVPADISNAERNAIATDFIKARIGDSGDIEKLTFTHGVDRMTAHVEGGIDAVLFDAVVTGMIDVAARSTVAVREEPGTPGDGKPLELALVVDTTDSVNRIGGTAEDVEAGIVKITKTVFGGKKQSDYATMSFVPVSDRVNLPQNYSSKWISSRKPSGWAGCIEPREGPIGAFEYALDDKPPSKGRFDPLHTDTVRPHYYGRSPDRFLDFVCPIESVLATDKMKDIIKRAAELRFQGTGRYDIGLAWGWRLLSPRWINEFKKKEYPAAYDAAEKRIVMISDGLSSASEYDFGEWEDVDGDGAKDASGNRPRTPFVSRTTGVYHYGDNVGSERYFEHFVDLCSRVKANGIEIDMIMIAGNPHAEKYFEQCATTPERFFAVESVQEFELAVDTTVERLKREVAPRRVPFLIK